MRKLLAVVSLLGLVSCAGPGSAEQFQWTVDCPKSVAPGAEFTFTVFAAKAGEGRVTDVRYRYEIAWPPGSGSPLRQHGSTGTPSKAHARVVPGPATLVIFGENREGAAVKVAEAGFEVKQ
jgi:hypothetical protein